MAKHRFKYYLHDDYTVHEFRDFLVDPKFGNLPGDVAEAIAEVRPFYEVTLDCEFDTETGRVTVLNTTL